MSRISEAEKERVKKHNPIKNHLQNRGYALKKKGKQYLCCCPLANHKDENASCSVDTNLQLWHCFGCNEGGDIYQLVMKMDGVDFREAHRRLGGAEEKPASTIKASSTEVIATSEIEQQQALSRYCQYYHQQLLEKPQGQDYLISRGLSLLAMTSFALGYVDGSIIDKLSPQDYQALIEIGVIINGRELMLGCVIFPLIDGQTNQIVSLYGRNIEGAQHLYLPGKRRGIVNPTGAKNCEEVVIVESVIDALALWAIGIRNIIPIYGINGLTDETINHLKECRVRKVVLMMDNDEAGEEATPRIKQQLSREGIDARIVKVPAKDPSEYVMKGGQLAEITKLLSNDNNEQQKLNGKKEDDGTIIFHLGTREYQVKGLTATGLDRLKVNIRVKSNGYFYLDTIDLYQAERRTRFAQAAAKKIRDTEQQIENELMEMIEPLEEMRLQMRKKGTDKAEKALMNNEERSAALAQLRDAKLIDWIVESVKNRGYIGDYKAIALAYLALTSRKLMGKKNKPLSLLFIARSGAGKSAFQEAICELMPPEDVVRVTRLTGQALFYKDPYSLQRKILSIAEVEGAMQAYYALRTLVSEQYLATAATRTDPQTGKLQTEHYELFGPVSVLSSTTAADAFDEETRNRFVQLTMDESMAQTKAILAQQRKAHTLAGMQAEVEQEKLQKLHQNLQRLLRPMRVYNPFMEQLTYPSDRLISRREQEKYISLINTIALLHQYQRKVTQLADGSESVEVEKSDVALANEIARELLWRSFDELSPPVRGMLQEIIKLMKEKAAKESIDLYEVTISRREIRKATNWTEWQVRVYCEKLVEMEYLQLVNGGQGKTSLYKLVAPIDDQQPTLDGLTDLNNDE